MAPSNEIDNDAYNDLFNYDAGLDEILRETVETNTNDNPADATKRKTGAGDLGLDEEVKVTRKRAPIAKLDENRLLSQNGIPKLRRTAKTKLRFKGKGHEFSDAARLLNFYQLWLDDLYPRAKFADALSIVEKLGHSKRMQIMRKEWIDEGKPKRYTHDASEEPTAGAPVNNGNMDTDRNDIGNNTSSEPQEPGRHDSGVQEQPTGDERPSLFGNGNGNQRTEFDFDDDDLFVPDTINGEPKGSAPSDNPPEEDDLDALLGETDGIEPRGAPTRLPPPVEDDFDGDMEAMDMYGV